MLPSLKKCVFYNTNTIFKFKKIYSTILNGTFNRNCDEFIKREKKYEQISEKINNIKSLFAEGGGERSKIKHIQHNKKMLAENRLVVLFDGGKYSELGCFVGYGQSYGDIPKAGCIAAIGRISGRLCAVVASDATVKGGTVYPIQLRKQLKVQNFAIKLRLPFIFLIDSGGAFLPLQADIFPDRDHGGRIFYNQAVMQSLGVTAISLVCGSCTAGAAYIPTMCAETGMVAKTSHIFLGGPPLVKAATGEIVGAEELGGASTHARISGCSDHTYETESDGLNSVRYMISTLPQQTLLQTNYTSSVDPLFPCDDLNGLLINYKKENSQGRIIITQILSRVLDESTMHEFKAEFGKGLVTGFGRISGYMVGVLAGYDNLTEKDCLKGSHFVQLCGHRNIPVISFIHTVDNSLSSNVNHKSREEAGSLIKAKAMFLKSVATRNSKMIAVVIGDAVGIDYLCMGGQSMEPDFIFAWPNARFGYDQTDLDNPDESSILKAAGNMVIDEIIIPMKTREVLTTYLQILNTQSNLPSQIISQPIYRF